MTVGETLAEAQRLAPETLDLHMQGMAEDGEAIPEPSTLDDLAGDPLRKDAVCILVSVDPPAEPTVRMNITARKSQVEAIDRMASRAGMTRSAFMVQSLLAGGDRKK